MKKSNEQKVSNQKSNQGFDREFYREPFMDLLGKSISSNEAEKSEFIESFAHLEQARIVELINLFIEEQKKFAALRDKHRHVGFFFDWLKTKTKKEWEEATRHYLEQKNNPSKIN